jgi:hypothetical protein
MIEACLEQTKDSDYLLKAQLKLMKASILTNQTVEIEQEVILELNEAREIFVSCGL